MLAGDRGQSHRKSRENHQHSSPLGNKNCEVDLCRWKEEVLRRRSGIAGTRFFVDRNVVVCAKNVMKEVKRLTDVDLCRSGYLRLSFSSSPSSSSSSASFWGCLSKLNEGRHTRRLDLSRLLASSLSNPTGSLSSLQKVFHS